jgi:hypothetical protein
MTEAQRRCLIEILTQEFVISFPYYSAIEMVAPRQNAGPGPYSYQFARGVERRAFSYAFENGTAEAAGFPQGYIAQTCDTNLGKAQETISGESVEIHGLAIQPRMGIVVDDGNAANSTTEFLTDARMMALASSAIFVGLQLNASQQVYKLGIFPMLPGAGGLEGSGFDGLGTQAIPGGRLDFGMVTNGRASHANYMYLPEGIVWLPAGKRDSQLTVVFRFCRTVTLFSGGDRDNQAADEGAGAGIRGYNYPEFSGFSLMTHLKGRTISKRSMVT